MSRPNRGRLERSARNLLVLYLVWSERGLPKSSRRLRIHPKKKRGRTSTEPFPFRLQHHVPFSTTSRYHDTRTHRRTPGVIYLGEYFEVARRRDKRRIADDEDRM